MNIVMLVSEGNVSFFMVIGIVRLLNYLELYTDVLFTSVTCV